MDPPLRELLRWLPENELGKSAPLYKTAPQQRAALLWVLLALRPRAGCQSPLGLLGCKIGALGGCISLGEGGGQTSPVCRTLGTVSGALQRSRSPWLVWSPWVLWMVIVVTARHSTGGVPASAMALLWGLPLPRPSSSLTLRQLPCARTSPPSEGPLKEEYANSCGLGADGLITAGGLRHPQGP